MHGRGGRVCERVGESRGKLRGGRVRARQQRQWVCLRVCGGACGLQRCEGETCGQGREQGRVFGRGERGVGEGGGAGQRVRDERAQGDGRAVGREIERVVREDGEGSYENAVEG